MPVVLHARDPRRGDVVVVCNAAAQQRGVRLSMPLAEAAALAGHDGECLILPHDPAADLKELARLAEQCERFSPMVGWQTQCGLRIADCRLPNIRPDCLFLDVAGIGVLFGGEEKLGREAIDDLERSGYRARVAIGDTIGATWAFARQKNTADVEVFRTQGSVPSTEICALSIDALRLPPETIDLLAQLGIFNLEQLLALPRESLRARFGELLVLRIDQLLGTAQEMIVPHRPPPTFTEQWLLEYPQERRELIESILRELIHRLATALANRREGVLKLSCRLDCAPGRPVLLDIGLFHPSADAAHLWNLVQMQLEQTAWPGPVGRVRLEAVLTAPLENRQGELFAGGQHQAEQQLALLIDRCSSRLGPKAVLRAELTADPLPERAVRYRAGVGFRVQGSGFRRIRSPKSKVGSQKSGYSVPGTRYSVLSNRHRKEHHISSDSAIRNRQFAILRPLLLHSPPLALDVLLVAPDGPLISFRWQGQKHQVAGSSGPERIETGWWRGKSVRRDYWRVETTGGQRFWLFRQLDDGRWFLHGEYT